MSAKGVDGVRWIGEVGADSGKNPMFLKISSFGDVAISLSNGVRFTFGESLGTARRIVPSGILASKFFDSFHLFDLLGATGALVAGGDVNAMLILVKAKACVVGVGVSAPLRLKIERLRLFSPFVVDCTAVGELFDMISDAMASAGIRSLQSSRCWSRRRSRNSRPMKAKES
jgi:hypothetical protein